VEFQSLLNRTADRVAPGVPEPDFFHDLNLDQLVRHLTANHKEFHLESFFYAVPHSLSTVQYRQTVSQDIARQPVHTALLDFAQEMRTVRDYLDQSTKVYFPRQKQACFLQGMVRYCAAVSQLAIRLALISDLGEGMTKFQQYLLGYTESAAFRELRAETTNQSRDLLAIEYDLWIQGASVTVKPRGEDSDFREELIQTFARFRSPVTPPKRRGQKPPGDMTQVEARILDLVARLNPTPFATLDRFCQQYSAASLDVGILDYERELHFYLSYQALVAQLGTQGLPFCYPSVSEREDSPRADAMYDIALALEGLYGRRPVPGLNSFALDAAERVLLISGPNQGGKTTFARAIGQVHYLARLGLPIPARAAAVGVCDYILTHFEREEDPSHSGTLANELRRLKSLVATATPQSLVVLNEMLSSTTLEDAQHMGREILAQLIARGALTVVVTFVVEWAQMNSAIASYRALVSEKDPTVRTYKIVRQHPDGQSYALSLANQYGLTKARIRERVSS
jgi:DNA mismatch repair protein MutS